MNKIIKLVPYIFFPIVGSSIATILGSENAMTNWRFWVLGIIVIIGYLLGRYISTYQHTHFID